MILSAVHTCLPRLAPPPPPPRAAHMCTQGGSLSGLVYKQMTEPHSRTYSVGAAAAEEGSRSLHLQACPMASVLMLPQRVDAQQF